MEGARGSSQYATTIESMTTHRINEDARVKLTWSRGRTRLAAK
jgi:hypothetical protein